MKMINECASARLVRVVKWAKKPMRYAIDACRRYYTDDKLTPAPYEKAQTSEEKIYMQTVRSSRQPSTEVLAVHECVVSE